MSQVRIVPMKEKYIESFHSCLDSVGRERKYLGFLQAPPLESTREFVQYNIQHNIPQFLVVENERVVGWCDIRPQRLEGFTHCGTLGMGILDGYRGRGYGTQLMDEALTAAKRYGMERVELEVYASNIPAIRLYEKKGFQHEGVKKKARKLDGVYDDIIMMALFI